MRIRPILALAIAALLVAGFLVAVRHGAMPLGVRGEWEWLRVPFGPEPIACTLAGLAVVGFAGFAAIGRRALGGKPSRAAEVVWLLALAVGGVSIQALAQSGAPPGHGLAKWVLALHQRGSSGYFLIAQTEARDLRRFLAEYPVWIQRQDALHIGTHPPGLIASQALLLGALERAPAASRFVEDHAPESVSLAFRFYVPERPMTPADRATLVLTGFLTLVACGSTVVPLYALARVGNTPASAWTSAALWPLVPSAVLFQPTADTAFPLLSTTALAFAAHAVGRPSSGGARLLAVGAGVVLGLGMQFSLVFLAVGLVVGVVEATASARSLRERLAALVLTGLGFLAVTLAVWTLTGANPFAIWWWNQRNHARFYTEFPRSYVAWVVANAVELAVGLGLPAVVWAVASLERPRRIPRPALAALGVLIALTLTGRNLSEVGRLWLPFMPALLTASGAGLDRLEAGPATFGLSVALLGLQTLALQAMIQVVYPV